VDEELEYVLERVRRHDDSRAAYLTMADSWEKMWRGDAGFIKPLHQAILQGKEQVILPTPFNVVNLSQRLLSTTPRIDVIPQDIGNRKSVEYAEQCEKWLTAMWKRINQDQRRNVLSDAIWYALVRGRFVFEVKWIKDALPSRLKKTTFPILVRTLDPMNVGIHQGPYATEFAYHKYETTLLDVLHRWPDLRDTPRSTKLGSILTDYERNQKRTEDLKVNVIDYWCMDEQKGDIRNGIIVEDEWAKELKTTSYPIIPLIAGRGDYAVGIGDQYDGLSILHSIDGLWQYQCRLMSQMATGLLWYFWPQFLVSNENNLPVDDIEIAPGATTPVPFGTKVDQVTMNPNVPLAESIYAQIEGHVQQSTYPEVMYGQAPGELQAGYGVSLLSDAAKGRIKNFQESLEMSLAHVHSLVLCLVEKKGGKEGVDIYGVNERDNEKYKLNLNKEMINGAYENEVRISPAIPQDDANRVVMGKQLADSKYISAQTLRDKFLGVPVPTDEARRIALEEAMQSDEMRNYRLRRALEDYFEEDMPTVAWDTPFMPLPPPGMEWTMGPQNKPILRPTPPTPPPGPMPMDPSMAPPTGGPPPLSGGGGASMMPPGPPMQPEATFTPPIGGGMPPVMQGQFEGENLGMPQDGPPLDFQLLMNQQLPPGEELRLAGGLPAKGPLPGGY
jgi:hypothetical protein